MENKNLGTLGELAACQYLIKSGYEIITRNYRRKFGEIDIVARQQDGAIIFCEIKAKMGEALKDGFMPEDHIDRRKYRKLVRVCSFFAGEYQYLINELIGWRIDVIAIVFRGDGDIVRLSHYKNV